MSEEEIEEIRQKLTPHTRELLDNARELIRSVYPDVVEVPWPRQMTIGYGIGPKKMSEHFAYIALHKDHINLGFNHGSQLRDQHQLLEGPGKLLRHHKISKLEKLDDPRLRELIKTAVDERLSALGRK